MLWVLASEVSRANALFLESVLRVYCITATLTLQASLLSLVAEKYLRNLK